MAANRLLKRRYASSDSKISVSDQYSRFLGLFPKNFCKRCLMCTKKHLDGSRNRADATPMKTGHSGIRFSRRRSSHRLRSIRER
jgi:hypothetical protein